MNQFPRSPITSAQSDRSMPRTTGYNRPAERQSYCTETHPYSDRQPHSGSDSVKYKEKAKFKEEQKESASITYEEKTEVSAVDHKHHESKQHESDKDHSKHHDNKGAGYGFMWIVWVILLFIIILFIIMAVFYFLKPDCVTKEECNDDGTRDIDFGKGALYAFVITFFLVLIICGCWYAFNR